jgi:hypothetical protein
MASMQIFCMCNNGAMIDIHFGTQRTESFQMLVDRTASDVTASGKWHFCVLVFSQECTEKIVGSADFLDKFIIHTQCTNRRSIDLNRRSVYTVYLRSNLGNCFQQYIDISYIR